MEPGIHLEATNTFYRNMEATERYVVNRGSAGSGKSYSILQLLIYKLLTEKNKSILILRKTLPSLRHSTYEAFLDLMDEMNVRGIITEEKQHLTYRYNGSFIRFGSVDDPEKIKSLNVNYIFLEEATDFTYNDFQLIKLRLRAPSGDGKRNQLFVAFNPVDESHWLKEKLIEAEDDCIEIHSTYKDNPYLDEDYRKVLEDLINQDINYYRVYALGEWGRLEGLIYPKNFKVTKTMENEVMANSFYGLDFGFNAPSALVEVIPTNDIKESQIVYLKEKLYLTGLTNSQLIDKLEILIPKTKRHKPIYCDSAEPDRIKEIRLRGFNARPAKKGKTIQNGIDIVKTYILMVLDGSENIIKEAQAYCWRVDKNGNVLEEPVKFNDHILDAIRYAIISHLKKADVRFRWLGKK